MYLNDILSEHLMSKSHLSTDRFPAFYPSSASCLNAIDNRTVIGSCLRQQFYKFRGYSESNPSGIYSQWIFAAGNIWEDYLIEQLKQMGLWLANSVKFANHDLFVSGEIDILIKGPNYDPKTDTGKWIVENKTYGAANYSAKKDICGARDQKPRPKDQNLIQSFIYLCTFGEQVDGVILNYIDRSCSGPENNKEFHITLHEEEGEFYPKITTTDFYGSEYKYIDRRITYSGIKNRFDSLVEYLKNDEVPAPEFQHRYTDTQIQEKYKLGLIYKTKYEEYMKAPDKKTIGDYQCSIVYCNYSDLCASHKATQNQL